MPDEINRKIMDNELSAMDWEHYDFAWELQWWIDFFNIAFFKDQPLPMPVLTFEKANVRSLGHYRIGLNDWAVKNQINLNKIYLDRPLYEILATLIHEMVHLWEYTHVEEGRRTKSWYHPKAFRNKMEEIGIATDKTGCHVYVGNPFFDLIIQHGVTPPINELQKMCGIKPRRFTIKKKRGSSKLKKWSCGCTNVRVAVKEFHAVCMKCGNMFKKA